MMVFQDIYPKTNMKAFNKLIVSRAQHAPGDKDIDGYFFKLSSPLTKAEKEELLDYVKEKAEYAFMPTYQYGTENLQTLHEGRAGDIAKTMFLLTTLKSKTGVKAFNVEKIYGISKIKCVVPFDGISTAAEAEEEAGEQTDNKTGTEDSADAHVASTDDSTKSVTNDGGATAKTDTPAAPIDEAKQGAGNKAEDKAKTTESKAKTATTTPKKSAKPADKKEEPAKKSAKKK